MIRLNWNAFYIFGWHYKTKKTKFNMKYMVDNVAATKWNTNSRLYYVSECFGVQNGETQKQIVVVTGVYAQHTHNT